MDKHEKNIGFALRLIKTEQFAVLSETYVLHKAVELGAELEFKIDQDNEHIGAFAGFEFIQDEKIFIKILVSCHFKIKSNSWVKLKNGERGKIIFPKEFIIHLATLAIGASRGVLSAKTESTIFSSVMIPLLDVTKIVTEDAEFDLDDNILK